MARHEVTVSQLTLQTLGTITTTSFPLQPSPTPPPSTDRILPKKYASVFVRFNLNKFFNIGLRDDVNVLGFKEEDKKSAFQTLNGSSGRRKPKE